MRGTDFLQGFVFDKPFSIVIEGGYDPTYGSNPSSSNLYGDVTITAGTVTISGLNIRGMLTVTGGTAVIDGVVIQ